MTEWISENWLAMYGAIVGSFALMLNVVRFFYDRKKDSVQIEVSGEPHPDYEEQVMRLKEGKKRPEYDRPGLLEVYKVQVTNTGNIPVHLHDAGVVSTSGESVSVLTRSYSGSNSNHLVPIESSGISPIAPKSSETFWVWLKIDQEPFAVSSYFATDRTGQRWSKKA
jgi:hypothetical protein